MVRKFEELYDPDRTHLEYNTSLRVVHLANDLLGSWSMDWWSVFYPSPDVVIRCFQLKLGGIFTSEM